MDLNDIWQGNKRFILGVGCALVLVLIGKTVVGSVWDARGTSSAVSSTAGKLRRLAAPKQRELSEVEGDNVELEERLDALYSRMAYATDEKYVLPKSEPNPGLVYNAIRSQAYEELVEFAARNNIRVAETLGLPEYTPSGREAIQRALRGLSIVEQIVGAAIVAGVREIPEIEIVEKRGSRRRQNESFIDALQVKFKIVGTTAAIAELVEGLVRGDGQFLCVEEAQIEVDDKRAFGLTELGLTVSGLDIDPEAPVSGAKR